MQPERVVTIQRAANSALERKATRGPRIERETEPIRQYLVSSSRRGGEVSVVPVVPKTVNHCPPNIYQGEYESWQIKYACLSVFNFSLTGFSKHSNK